jgi:hypothetical protein
MQDGAREQPFLLEIKGSHFRQIADVSRVAQALTPARRQSTR